MKKNILSFLIIILFLFALLSGCINNSTNEIDRFIGTWKTDQGLIFIFYKNGTCMMQGWFSGIGTWEISGYKLNITIDFTDGKNYMAYDYKFSDDNTALTLTDAGGNSWIYSKQ